MAKSSFHTIENQIKSAEVIPQENLDCNNPAVVGEALANVIKLAEHNTAKERSSKLNLIAKEKMEGHQKWLLRFLAMGVGMVGMSAGAMIITARLGPLTVPASLGFGMTLTLIGDGSLTKAHTNSKRRQWSREAINIKLESVEKYPPQNKLALASHEKSIELIKQVEGDPSQKSFPKHAVVALILNLAEYSVNLWIVSQFGLPGGLLLEILVSSLPIGIQCAASIAESEGCELPKIAEDLGDTYEGKLWKEGEQPDNPKERLDYRVGKLDATLKFIPHGDPAGILKNLAMAHAQFDIDFFSQMKNLLEKRRLEELHQTRQRHLDAKKDLPNQYIRPNGITEQENELAFEQWLSIQIAQLEQATVQDMEAIAERYATEISFCEKYIEEAQKRFLQLEAEWRRQHPDEGPDALPPSKV